MDTFLTAVDANDPAIVRIGVPSKGRLRDKTIELLSKGGYPIAGLRGTGSVAKVADMELIEMRPRDAAAALHVGTLDAAFISTDIAMEYALRDTHTQVPLQFARNDLVVASRDDDGRTTLADLEGGTVATHMPHATRAFFMANKVDVRIVHMGGSLEGVCAAGLADAIVDNAETGTSLRQNRLRVLATIAHCQAELAYIPGHPSIDELVLRLGAVLAAQQAQYVMLHIPKDKLSELSGLFHGLESPTLLPLAGREDLVAVHFVTERELLWRHLADLRAIGATGIVALPPTALLA